MSLDVYLKANPTEIECICDCCGNVHKTIVEPECYWANITHNLTRMARAAGIEDALWSPEEIGATKAGQLIEPIRKGLELLKAEPETFKQYNASNGWGTYEQFVPWVENYLNACIDYPDANVSVSR